MVPRIYQKIIARFRDIYGAKGEAKLYFAPGRITILGEHTDYSGGSILSCAVERGTYIVMRKRHDNKVNMYAHNIKAKKTLMLDKLEAQDDEMWVKQAKGIFATLIESDLPVMGMDLLIYGDLPYNASMAASSSLCASLTLAVIDTNNIKITEIKELAELSYKGETKFASHKTNLADHIAIFAAKKGNLTLLDSKTMGIEYVPFDFSAYSLVVINSNKKRSIADSEYNSRKRECANAFKKIKEKKKNVDFICDLLTKDIKFLETNLAGKEQRRAIYAVEENERVKEAVKAVSKNKIKDLAKIIINSHEGLRRKYEVSSAELDIIVEECIAMPYVHGAKMIGLGFGGGVLSFIEKEMVEIFIETLYVKYKEHAHRDSDVYILKPSDGARAIPVEE